MGARADARVVICGDSAGGNLAMGVCLRAASLDLAEMPAGCLVAYAPMLIAYVPSPSRMLSVCDPLLPIGIVSRCMIGRCYFFFTAASRNMSFQSLFFFWD